MGATISDDTARDILAKAFLESLPRDSQETLLREAIVRLMTEKEKNSYNNPHGLTTLERVFQEEVTRQIREMLAAMLREEPLKQQLHDTAKELLSKGMKKFEVVYEAAVQAMLEKALGVKAW